MSMQEKIQRLVEERRAEANKKDLSKKLRRVVYGLGQEIRGPGGANGSYDVGIGYSTSDAFDDWFSLGEDDQSLPTMDDDSSQVLFYQFDGLSNGVNLQIIYEPAGERIRVTFHGNQVYLENQGIIESYVPSDKWETQLESLFVIANQKAKLKDQRLGAEKELKNQARKSTILDYLNKIWGV